MEEMCAAKEVMEIQGGGAVSIVEYQPLRP
jgi:hypothetical protein